MSSRDCVAVGSASYAVPVAAGVANEVVTLAEPWDGTSWTLETTPNPAAAGANGLTSAQFSAVSCTSSSACTAVGLYYDWPPQVGSVYIIPLAERWDGDTWTLDANASQNIVTEPSGAEGESLWGVSCATSTNCVATGHVEPYGSSLAEGWDGIGWGLQGTADPTNIFNGYMAGVACTTPTSCVAVGHFVRPGTTHATQDLLAQRWDGDRWARLTPSAPPDAVRGPTFLTFSGVSCLAATWCTAVGNYARIGGHFAGLVERLTGDTWTIEPSERPTGATDVRLASVSCTTPMNCVAVGNTQDGGEQRALAERFIANPINRFAVSDVHALRDGGITFRIRAPSDGRVDVLLTAWNDNLARTAVLEPAPRRFVFARAAVAVTAGARSIVVRPNSRGQKLVAHPRYGVTLRFWVSYTPLGGRARSQGFYGLRLKGPKTPASGRRESH